MQFGEMQLSPYLHGHVYGLGYIDHTSKGILELEMHSEKKHTKKFISNNTHVRKPILHTH